MRRGGAKIRLSQMIIVLVVLCSSSEKAEYDDKNEDEVFS
jgi:hypothetical protein